MHTKIAANTIRQSQNIKKTQNKRIISAYISETTTQQIWDKPQYFYWMQGEHWQINRPNFFFFFLISNWKGKMEIFPDVKRKCSSREATNIIESYIQLEKEWPLKAAIQSYKECTYNDFISNNELSTLSNIRWLCFLQTVHIMNNETATPLPSLLYNSALWCLPEPVSNKHINKTRV